MGPNDVRPHHLWLDFQLDSPARDSRKQPNYHPYTAQLYLSQQQEALDLAPRRERPRAPARREDHIRRGWQSVELVSDDDDPSPMPQIMRRLRVCRVPSDGRHHHRRITVAASASTAPPLLQSLPPKRWVRQAASTAPRKRLRWTQVHPPRGTTGRVTKPFVPLGGPKRRQVSPPLAESSS